MMFSLKRIFVLGCFGSFIYVGLLSARPPEAKKKYKNLKVLSYNIEDENMEWVMETFNAHLGVNCLFCHPAKQNGTEYKFDYATDQLQNKRIARDMLRMTMRLNKKYFNSRLTSEMNTRGVIWCKTCHGGKPVPIIPQLK